MEPNDKLLPVAESALWSQECLRRANLSKMGISPLISRFHAPPIGMLSPVEARGIVWIMPIVRQQSREG